MDNHTLVSIIIAVYNIEKYIAKCIDSSINQSYSNIEIILVDDGSRDRSGSICDEYARKDSRIHVIHKANGGLSDARNSGVKYSHDNYIMFVDGDDYIAPDMCEKLLNAVIKQNAELGICNFHVVYEGNIHYPGKLKSSLSIKNEVLSGHTIINEKLYGPEEWIWCVSWNKLYRRDIFDKLSFPIGKLHEDEFVCFDLFSRCSRVACIANPLYYYVQRENSITTASFSVRRLDGCEALFQRADKLIENGYTSESIYYSIISGIFLLRAVFECGLYKENTYRCRYIELMQQLRKLGFFRLLFSIHGIKNKTIIAIAYINPKVYCQLCKVRDKLRQ